MVITDITLASQLKKDSEFCFPFLWQERCRSKIPGAWLCVYSQVSNRTGGQNKQGGWQISAKIIKGNGAINGKIGKVSKVNKRRGWNKIIKRSCENINKKNIRNTKLVIYMKNHFQT